MEALCRSSGSKKNWKRPWGPLCKLCPFQMMHPRPWEVKRLLWDLCCCSVAKLGLTLVTPWTAARQASLSLTISQSLPKFMSIESVMSSNHHILCRPLLLLPSIFPSIRVFSNQSAKASVLPLSVQGWFPLTLTGLISLLSKGLSRAWKHQFFSTLLSLWSSCHIRTQLLERPQPLLYGPWSAKWCLCFVIHCLGLS